MTMEILKEIQAEQEVISQRLSVLEGNTEKISQQEHDNKIRLDEIEEAFNTLRGMTDRVHKVLISHVKIMNKQSLKIAELELRLMERDVKRKDKFDD